MRQDPARAAGWKYYIFYSGDSLMAIIIKCSILKYSFRPIYHILVLYVFSVTLN